MTAARDPRALAARFVRRARATAAAAAAAQPAATPPAAPAPELSGTRTTELGAALVALLDEVHARWPDLALDDGDAIDALAERLAETVPAAGAAAEPAAAEPAPAAGSGAPAGGPADPAAIDLPPFAADLVLGQACLRGAPAALRALEREMFAKARVVLGRLRLAPEDLDDVLQDVRTKLVVGPQPRLAQFEGRGPLGQWVASVAWREGLMLLRRRRLPEPLDDDAILDAGDPELAMLRAQHGGELKRAFHEALAQLSPRDRTVLRALIVDDRSVNEIAAFYRIHRVTASRWIAEIRRTLLRDTRRRLQASLHLDAAGLDSAVRLVESQLDLSLYRLLAAPGASRAD